jgi:L-rhamnose-H+ transport protein
MGLLIGFLLVFLAGVLQGTFILPMTLTRRWNWEHTWAAFSFFGMLAFNWGITLLAIPNIISVYRLVPPRYIAILTLFGAGWGLGAILFGLGMDKLGMALGYPIIMGLIASLGALIPLLVFSPAAVFEAKGVVLLIGTVIMILGIAVCSFAGVREPRSSGSQSRANSHGFAAGLVIAIAAGVLSCLPNVGMAFGTSVIVAAQALGTSRTYSGNAIWALFFTVGFLLNFGYGFYLMARHKNLNAYLSQEAARNFGLSALMAIMWIVSFYLYGMGAAKLGKWGVVVGWPLFISLSIAVGNLWGILRGEWQDAPRSARILLYRGLFVLLIAVITIAGSNLLL